MQSRWYGYKDKAIGLRQKGVSIVVIESKLGIPRSTLSGWFADIKLSKTQKDRLSNNKLISLAKARKLAAAAHNHNKQVRVKEAESRAKKIIENINFNDEYLVKITLALLYLGEGFKKVQETGMGNSDPLIVRFFVSVLQKYYAVPKDKMRCELYIRHDQNEEEIKKYWSKQLDLPITSCTYVHKDKRTIKTKTYHNYFGVCTVRCGHIAIQRELLYLSREFCRQIISESL